MFQSKIGFVMRLEKSGFCLSSGFYMQAATFTHYLQNHSAPFFLLACSIIRPNNFGLWMPEMRVGL